MSGLFITATDTGAGKTLVSLALMEAMQQRGLTVLGMKPVATGCDPTAHGLRNDDALKLQAKGSDQAPYETINPYAFEPPVSPHIAAGQAGVEIELRRICSAYQALAEGADRVIVEGVGGWRVPLGVSLSVNDIPVALGIPVVMVIGLRLGCLNHSLLTAEAIRSRGVRLAGWVVDVLEPDMLAVDENIATLAALIDAPNLGVVPWLQYPRAEDIAPHLSIEGLLAGKG